MKLTTTTVRDGKEIEIEVTYNFSKGCRGARDSCGGKAGAGPPLEPDDPDEMEIESVVTTTDNKEIELTDQEMEKVEESCWEAMANDDAEYDYYND